MRFQFSSARFGALAASVLLAGAAILALAAPAQAALLTYKVTAAAAQPAGVHVNPDGSVSIDAGTAIGTKVNLEIHAIINGTNPATSGFAAGPGSLLSGANGANARLLGNLKGATNLNAKDDGTAGAEIGDGTTFGPVAPFNASGSSAGFMRDLDGDTDGDFGNVASNTSSTNSNEWFFPFNGQATSTLGSLDNLIGRTYFALATNAAGSSTIVGYTPRLRTLGLVGQQATNVYQVDGVQKNERSDNVDIARVGVLISVIVPEPGSLVLLGLGGIGLLLCRRNRRSVA